MKVKVKMFDGVTRMLMWANNFAHSVDGTGFFRSGDGRQYRELISYLTST